MENDKARRSGRLSCLLPLRHWTLALSCLASSLLGGCANKHGILGVDRCADIPCGAIPEPAGTKVCQWQTVQVSNALIDQGTFHLSDFVGRTPQLSPAAMERLARTTSSGLAASLEWIIEPSGDLAVDEARVASVIDALHSAGLPVAGEQVRIAYPAALGLSGAQAERVGVGAARAISQGSGFGGGLGRGGFGFGGRF